jgi:hypothetical protein
MNEEELLSEGYLKVYVLLEIVGKPAEHVEKAIRAVMGQIKDTEGIEVLDEDIGKPEKTDDGFYGVFAEFDAYVQNLQRVGYLATNYTPATIELVEPEEMQVGFDEFNEVFGDTLSKLHMNNMQINELKQRRQQMTRSLNALAQNAILLSLQDGEKSLDAIAEDTGLNASDAENMLEAMEKEGKVASAAEGYELRG